MPLHSLQPAPYRLSACRAQAPPASGPRALRPYPSWGQRRALVAQPVRQATAAQPRRTAERVQATVVVRSAGEGDGRWSDDRVDSKDARDLRALIKTAPDGREVGGLLKSGIRRGLASIPLVTAALDRLMYLHRRQPRQRGSKGASPEVEAAYRVALQQGLALLPQANAWMLVAMARASFWLRLPLQPEEQQRVAATFIEVTEQAVSPEDLRILEDSNCEQYAGAVDRMQRTTRELANFMWAAFGDPSWCRGMSAEQQAALRRLARRQQLGGGQNYANMLIALVRLKSFGGPEAVAPWLDDGTVSVIVQRISGLVQALEAPHCDQVLLGVGSLGYRIDPSLLAAILRRHLAVLDEEPRAVHSLQRGFDGLSLLDARFPQDYKEVLRLPELEALCREFVARVELPRHKEEWAKMLSSCGRLGYNPVVGGEGEHLFDLLLLQLPSLAPALSPFDATDVLEGLDAFYGLPSGSALAPALQPYRQQLVLLAYKVSTKLELYWEKRSWRAIGTLGQLQEMVAAFAALDG